MTNSAPLTIAFIQKHPVAAARSLMSISPEDGAAFLDSIPTRFAVEVLSQMGIWSASQIVARMQLQEAAAVIRELDYQDATAILRLFPPKSRGDLLEELPKRLKRDLEKSLSFPNDTVGARMTTVIPTFPLSLAVGDVVTQIRRSLSSGNIICVVDEARKFAGLVRPIQLIQHARDVRLSDIMDSAVSPLLANARIAGVLDLESWGHYVELPVVSRQNFVIGSVSRAALRKGLEIGHAGFVSTQSPITASIGEAFLISALGLARMLTDVGSLWPEPALEDPQG